MTIKELTNEQIVLTFSQAWTANDLGRFGQVAAEEFQAQGSYGKKPLTIQEFIAYNQRFLDAFPGSIMESQVIVSQDDFVVTHWKISGVHTATLQLSAETAIPATGKPVTVLGSSTNHLHDGKIIQLWSFWDMASLLTQMGLLPIP